LVEAGSERAAPGVVGCKAEEESDSGAIADDDNAADCRHR
jgi:hypothetical protein